MSEDWGHSPVLLEEAMKALQVGGNGLWIDGTFGRGGHSAAMLGRLGSDARLMAFDRDPEAQVAARRRFSQDPRFEFYRTDFASLERLAADAGIVGQVRGILLDLGVSSPQLEIAERGFSFRRDGPLDMRMNPDVGESAADWLATASAEDLSRVFKKFGEERFHRRVARSIVETRDSKPLLRTSQLADLVAAAVPTREPGQHPATRVFQAIRIWVNQELQQLADVLQQAVGVLAPGGRLVVISFHSLEDRIVKRFMREQARGVPVPRGIPVRHADTGATLMLVSGPARPTPEECRRNPRARSALLRAAERLQ